jgi:exodeoxyribonuclease-3
MMTIATFNANSIRSRLGTVLGWLAAHKPDVLCIQETKAQDADFPVDTIRDAGWHVVFRGEKSYNGVAIISRSPADEVVFGFDDGGPEDATRLVRARFGDVHVVNSYVPQGREIDHAMYTYKIEWLGRLRTLFDRCYSTRDKLLWTGDLNVAPFDIDVDRPETKRQHVCFHEAVRKAFADVVGWGLVDVYRQHHPEPGRYSFYDYRQPRSLERNQGWRIDHLLATPPLAAKARAAEIDLEPRRAEKPSDHTFVWASFDV